MKNNADFWPKVCLQHLWVRSANEFHEWWLRQLRTDSLQVIFTPNAEQLMLARKNTAFRSALSHHADILLPDSHGLIWACEQWKLPVPTERVTGTDTLTWWLQWCSQHASEAAKHPTLLLGAREGIAPAVAKKFDPEQHWCLGIAGYAQVQSPTQEEEAAVRAAVQDHAPAVIAVAFGAPWQELWVQEHRSWLAAQGVQLVLVCGGALDVLSGELQRAPRWMRGARLEWLYRLWQQPARWRRQLELISFVRWVWSTR